MLALFEAEICVSYVVWLTRCPTISKKFHSDRSEEEDDETEESESDLMMWRDNIYLPEVDSI